MKLLEGKAEKWRNLLNAALPPGNSHEVNSEQISKVLLV